MICETTGKVCYPSRRHAKHARKQAPRLRTGSNARGSVRPYRCPACDSWHLGHMPREVVRTSRAETFDGVKPPPRPQQVITAPAAPRVRALAVVPTGPIVVSAHVWFATRFCDEPRCAHEQPCPLHERRAA